MSTVARAAAAAALAALSLAVPAGAAAPPSPAARLGAAADAVVAGGAPAVSVLVRDGGRTLTLARGYADVAAKRSVTARDRFRVGSVTKSFVATVVLQLVAEGKLSLDDTVERRLPGLLRDGGAITIRELLSHTSGLPDYFADDRVLAPYAAGHLRYDWSHEAIVRLAAGDRRLFAPGAPGRWAYSNTNYYVLGLLVERMTGRSLASELRRRIFAPLGLSDTSLPSGPFVPGRHAHGYTKYFGPLRDVTTVSESIQWAAGGIVSTPTDVARFYRALLGVRLLPRRLVHAMASRVALPAGPSHPGFVYGLGLFRQPLPCGYAWGHNGDFPGYHMDALTSLDGRHQVVVSVNEDADETLPPAAGKALLQLVETAFCRGLR